MNFKHKLIATIGAAAAVAVVPMVAKYEGTVLRTYRDPILDRLRAFLYQIVHGHSS